MVFKVSTTQLTLLLILGVDVKVTKNEANDTTEIVFS